MIALVLLALLGSVAAQSGDCTDYCQTINDVCMGANAQFPPYADDTFSICESACATYPFINNGTELTSGDSYDCRMYHLGVAAGSAANAVTHCPHAGFEGEDNQHNAFCGNVCQAYCDNIIAACTDYPVFTDWDQCYRLCMVYPRNDAFNKTSNAIPSDNSVECRAWHSQVAYTTNPSVHCQHASPQGGSLCGANGCENFCDTVMYSCTGDLQQYETRATCIDSCMAFPEPGNTQYTDPETPVTTGNSVACRVYHAQVANTNAQSATTHCIHSGPTGGNSAALCGTECEGYCSLLNAACGDTVSDCLTTCATLTPTDASITSKDIYEGKKSVLGDKSVACGISSATMSLEDDDMCAKARAGECSGVSALKASWAVLALVVLALGLNW